MAVGQNAVGTDLYQWDNVPKAVVEGLEGSLNVPVSETVMWTNNITYMLKSENWSGVQTRRLAGGRDLVP